MIQDPYVTLGLRPGAAFSDVKVAYRALVKTLHPDINPDPAATAIYIAVTAAYEVLEKREKTGPPQREANGKADPFKAAFADFFEDLGKSSPRSEVRSKPKPGQRGDDIDKTVTLSLERVFLGGTFTVPGSNCRCPRCNASGRVESRELQPCPSCGGVGFCRVSRGFTTLEQSCERCHRTGSIREEDCHDCQGTGKSSVADPVRATIDPGCAHGQVIVVRGGGEPGIGGRGAGDMHITINIKPHPVFQRVNCHLEMQVTIPVWDAALGVTIPVVGIDGSEVRVLIPAGTQHGQIVRVADAGMPILHGRGDLLVNVQLDVPAATSGKLRSQFLALKELSS